MKLMISMKILMFYQGYNWKIKFTKGVNETQKI